MLVKCVIALVAFSFSAPTSFMITPSTARALACFCLRFSSGIQKRDHLHRAVIVRLLYTMQSDSTNMILYDAIIADGIHIAV